MSDFHTRLQAICSQLPGVTERVSHGDPCWFTAKNRSFASFHLDHHGEPTCLWAAAPVGAQEALIASAPQTFFRPPYVGPSGWIGMWLTETTDWEEVEGIIFEAHSAIVAKSATRK